MSTISKSTYGYVRVSTREQKEDRQLLALRELSIPEENIFLDKQLMTEDFFRLSTGLSGELLQKYVNYGGRIAIYGGYSHYTSKPLKNFIYENNKERDVFFHTIEKASTC